MEDYVEHVQATFAEDLGQDAAHALLSCHVFTSKGSRPIISITLDADQRIPRLFDIRQAFTSCG
jgi:hypothetical protein